MLNYITIIMIVCMEEPKFTMKLMYTNGAMTVKNEHKDSNKTYKNKNGSMNTTTFKYTELFFNHFLYRHTVDVHCYKMM